MARDLIKPKKRAPRKPRKDEVAVVEPTPGALFSFRYSSTEISLVEGKTHVKSRRARFEDGKLTGEAFEGELDRSAYERAVREAQRHLLGTLAMFLPFRD